MDDTASFPLRPPGSSRKRIALGIGAVAGLIAIAGVLWWQFDRPAPTPAPVAAPAPAAEAPPPAPPAPVAEAPAPEPKAAATPLDAQSLGAALNDVFGAKGVSTLLRLDDFARRFVATVDNLPRTQAPASLWPVKPAAGRFTVVERTGARVAVSPDNAARYTPLVLLAEQADAATVVALYVRALPLLQQAYEDLGYPKGRFHTRLLAVIDHLLAAPPAPEILEVTLTEVKGDIPSTRPWLRYEFVDPALEQASAGHKMMLRVGATNERRLKARLQALRAELVRVSQT